MRFKFEYDGHRFWLYSKAHWWCRYKKVKWTELHYRFILEKRKDSSFVTFKNYKEILNGFLLDPKRYPKMIIKI